MTTMHRHVSLQSFDMWHDYMNLCSLLERLSHGDPEHPEKEEEAAAAWRPIRTSTETSSASSLSGLSDSSCSGTSSGYCRFCKQNGESARVYRSHLLKSDEGKVICPILWSYTCPICAATGDRAHTRRYCPQARRGEAPRKPLQGGGAGDRH